MLGYFWCTSIFGNIMSCLCHHSPRGPQGPPHQTSTIGRPHIWFASPTSNHDMRCFLNGVSLIMTENPALDHDKNPDGIWVKTPVDNHDHYRCVSTLTQSSVQPRGNMVHLSGGTGLISAYATVPMNTVLPSPGLVQPCIPTQWPHDNIWRAGIAACRQLASPLPLECGHAWLTKRPDWVKGR